MPKRKSPEEKPGDQHRAFVEAAQAIGCDDDESAFDAKLKKVASAPLQKGKASEAGAQPKKKSASRRA